MEKVAPKVELAVTENLVPGVVLRAVRAACSGGAQEVLMVGLTEE